MHSLVPHQHHGEVSAVEHQLKHASADDFLDYLELLFHLDIGESHLEHFDSADGPELEVIATPPISSDCLWPNDYPYLSTQLVPTAQAPGYPTLDLRPKDRPVESHSLRGPPTLA